MSVRIKQRNLIRGMSVIESLNSFFFFFGWGWHGEELVRLTSRWLVRTFGWGESLSNGAFVPSEAKESNMYF